MIVITLTNVPKSLKGDLTKWYQEIQTNVYVGNVSARIRDQLWHRIMENIGHGEATMVYNSNNELGYQFRTTRKDREVVNFDGLPLMRHLNVATGSVNHGFSDAAKFHRAKLMTRASRQPVAKPAMVALDLETTGLDLVKDDIISIGAVKRVPGQPEDFFDSLIKAERAIPENITTLTGLTAEMLATQGISLSAGLQELREFVGSLPIVGYNLRFDEMFLTSGFRTINQPELTNRMIDLLPMMKKTDKFLDNYRLQTVLAKFDIVNQEPHHALADAKAAFALADKLIENRVLKI
ncbi:type I-E CRISPR-associated endoribonuclease Cas2e [Levilactobacillus brevis]|uniref:type I-E CRISPR-associated endoribonuclease Cas2e n=1 Tax=Levilactobacillus brevis TaxID=1580 RepID=UPI0035A36641